MTASVPLSLKRCCSHPAPPLISALLSQKNRWKAAVKGAAPLASALSPPPPAPHAASAEEEADEGELQVEEQCHCCYCSVSELSG